MIIRNLAREVKNNRQNLSSLEEELKSRGNEPEIGFKSLPQLNAKIWGFKKGLNVIGARTSIGKSAMAIQIALDLAKQGKKVVFLSLEMTEGSILERMFCNEYQINNFDIQRGLFMVNTEIRERWEKFKEVVLNMPYFLITCGIGSDFNEINVFIEKVLQPKPQVIILDYVQMVRGGFKERENLSEYVRMFRQLMLTNDMVGIMCSQVNRMVEKDNDYRPRLENLKSTGSLEEVCDLCLLLHWNYFYTKKEEQRNEYDVLIAKNRSGNTGVHTISYAPEYYKFEEKVVDWALVKNVKEVFGEKLQGD